MFPKTFSAPAIPKEPKVVNRNELYTTSLITRSFPRIPVTTSANANKTITVNAPKPIIDFYKKDITFNMLGRVGDIVEQWKLVGAFIQTANFGQYDWAVSDQVDLTMTVSMDYCVLNY